MDSTDDMDLESMINNPFQFIDSDDEATQIEREIEPETSSFSSSTVKKTSPSSEHKTAGINIDRINKNHPLELRMLGFEKNQLNWDKKVEMLKEIVEHQNERIELLEKELDILRKQNGA
ncbi:hypothetical protein ACFL60_02085 [Candidatus Omnitrophota bacterium]